MTERGKFIMFGAKRASFLLAVAALTVFSFALANSTTEIVLDHMTGLVGGDTVQAGTSVKFTFRLTYTPGTGDSIIGSTNGFKVWTYNSIASPATPGYFTPITYDTLTVSPTWAIMYAGGIYLSPFGVDGQGADTIGFGGFTGVGGTGIPDGFWQNVWWVETTPSTDGDTLCIDSSFYPPAGPWLWSTSGGSVQPSWYGPYCYHVREVPNVPPYFTNCSSPLYFDHCFVAMYDFNAVDPEDSIITYSLFSGLGDINSVTGEWVYVPSLADVFDSPITLCVEACDPLGACDTCCVDLYFTNTGPVFVGGCDDTITVDPGSTAQQQMSATDDCDPITYFIAGVSPTPAGTYSIDGTGLLTFNTDPSDSGLYWFEVCVTDGLDTAWCPVYFLCGDGGGPCCYLRGNADGDNGVNVADLTFLVDFLFRGGLAPPCQEEGDVDASGEINVADLTYLVDYLFRGGPAPPPCDAVCPDSLVILTPQPGDVLPSDQLGFIDAQLVPTVDNVVLNVEIVAEKQGGEMYPIDQGDLRSFAAPDLIRALWDLDDVPSGDYLITITVELLNCSTLEATVPVTVNRAPTVDIGLVSCESVPEEMVVVTLEALPFDSDGDSVTQFVWEAGDGSDPEMVLGTTLYTHYYIWTDTTFVVRVTAYDERGGTGFRMRDLALPVCSLQETHDCGCREMWIYSVAGNNSFIYCAAAVPGYPPDCFAEPNPPAGVCPPGQVAFRCPRGPFSPPARNRLGWTWEVNAKIDPRTNDFSACQQGQFARGTRTRTPIGGAAANVPNPRAAGTPAAGVHNLPDGSGGPAGVNFTVVGPPNAYPGFVGPNFGADNYTTTFSFKRHTDNRFRWLDAPGVAVNPALHSAATQQDEFVAYVRGNLGTCWCQFRIRHQWTAAGGRQAIGGGPAPNVKEKVDGHNCGAKK